MNFKFKEENSFEKRKNENETILKKHPKKIPIIVEKAPQCKSKNIDKTKFLVESSLTLPYFYATIKQKCDLDEKEAIFLLANGKITLSQNETMGDIYKKYKDKDGYLYIAYATEEIWG